MKQLTFDELTDSMWGIVRVFYPEASGNIEDFLEPATFKKRLHEYIDSVIPKATSVELEPTDSKYIWGYLACKSDMHENLDKLGLDHE